MVGWGDFLACLLLLLLRFGLGDLPVVTPPYYIYQRRISGCARRESVTEWHGPRTKGSSLFLSISVSICDNCSLRNLKAPTCPQLLYPDHSGKSPLTNPRKKTFGSTNLAPPPPHPTLPHPKSPTISSPPHTIAHVGKLPLRGEKGGKGT